MYVLICMPACVRIFLNCFFVFVSENGSLAEPDLTNWLDYMTCKQGLHVSALVNNGLQAPLPHTAFYLGMENPNSGSHAYTAILNNEATSSAPHIL